MLPYRIVESFPLNKEVLNTTFVVSYWKSFYLIIIILLHCDSISPSFTQSIFPEVLLCSLTHVKCTVKDLGFWYKYLKFLEFYLLPWCNIYSNQESAGVHVVNVSYMYISMQ